jgi:hypothetical protein
MQNIVSINLVSDTYNETPLVLILILTPIGDYNS